MTRTTDDHGFVTAEAALVFPSLMLVLLLALGVIAAVGTELRCVDAAREGARQASRGETDATTRAAAREVLPGATVVVKHRAGTVQVEVSRRLQPWRLMPAVTLRATAQAEEESR